MNIRVIKTRVFKEGEDLVAFIKKYVPKLKNGSVLVVTSKIVALAEGRTALPKNAAKIIRAESAWVKKTKYGKLTLKDGMYMWNAGIDESNANGKIVLLPKDSFASAKKLYASVLQKTAIRKFGVIITDSRIMPLRAGVVGVALGYAGFKGLRDYRGKKDIFGRKLKYTQTDMADALASAAIAVMGEGSERQPLCVIENAPVEFTVRTNKRELLVSPADDMYRPLFKTQK
ncbi:MAG TPA: coenzyme F420-0:L-glutamate ligase [Candidatus Paceibacterota bacterium]